VTNARITFDHKVIKRHCVKAGVLERDERRAVDTAR
jgi:hypothetical protein